jgi:hypothetical protein
VHVHFGTLRDICAEKHSELPEDKRKYKGRVVFGGHDVRNEAGLQVLFDDGGSGASFISASKLLDAVAMLPGNAGEQADAPMAYTQCELGAETEGPTTQTWVELPTYMWPREWVNKGYRRPVVPLRLALYGHPMAGVYWERYSHARPLKVGFERIPGWECLFVHWKHQGMLSVYMDDFKVAGNKENIPKAWEAIRDAGIELDKVEQFNHYLGCGQTPIALSHQEARDRVAFSEPWTEQIPGFERFGAAGGDAKRSTQIRGCRYDMGGFFAQCVERYCELAELDVSSLKYVAAPYIDDHQIKPEEFTERGILACNAAKILTKVLYGARLLHYDALWSVCSLAGEVTRWTRACDRRLHRLIAYLHYHQDLSLESLVGDYAKDLTVALFTDADFAGDTKSSKSTSAVYLAIVGPRTFIPVMASSKKQSAVSHSSTESEIIALEYGLRSEGLPVLTFWEHVVKLLHGNQAKGAPGGGRPLTSWSHSSSCCRNNPPWCSGPTGGIQNAQLPT